MADHSIKVVQMDDIEWWAGKSLADCVAAGREACGADCFPESDVQRELTDDEVQGLIFVDEDGSTRTFAEELERRVATGEKFPQPFAAEDW